MTQYAVLDDEPEWLEGLPSEVVFACEAGVGLTVMVGTRAIRSLMN